MDPTAVF